MALTLKEAQRDRLAKFDKMLALIRDRTRTVAFRHQTGEYLCGRPGALKTWTVTETLQKLSEGDRPISFVIENARMSPASLFELMMERPDSVIVLDDLSLLFGNKQGVQILMAALGGDPGKPRRVTYSIKGSRQVCYFSGGIIAISNLPLKSDPLANALKSRVIVLEHEPTDEMLHDYMIAESGKGYKTLSSEECGKLAAFIYVMCKDSDYRMDLRYYYKGLEDVLFVKSGHAESDWPDLVGSSMKRIHDGEIDAASPATREARTAWERNIARDLFAKKEMTKAERDAEWRRMTGKAPDSLYRRKRELGI